jgi:hypothetical protein
MKDLTPLTSRNGESEWQHEGKTLIAVLEKETSCYKCYFDSKRYCSELEIGVHCCSDFKEKPDVIFIEKPAES